MADEMRHRLVQAPPGIPGTRLVADDEVDIGFQQLSKLVGHEGVQMLGVLPRIAIDTVFTGAVAATAADPAVSLACCPFFTSTAVASIMEAHHFVDAFARRAE